MSKITKETLGYMIAKLPNKDGWKKYYARCYNAQLMFCPSVKRHDFKHNYLLYKCFVRKTRAVI